MAEGAAESTSFGVIGCTKGCGASCVFGWGFFVMGYFRLERLGLVASVGVVLAFWGFWGCMLCHPLVMWCIFGGCVGSPESR